MVFENVSTEHKQAVRLLKAQGVPIDEWIGETTDIGFQEHHANIIGQARARSLRHQNARCLNCGESGRFQKDCEARRFRVQNSRYIDSREHGVYRREQAGSG